MDTIAPVFTGTIVMICTVISMERRERLVPFLAEYLLYDPALIVYKRRGAGASPFIYNQGYSKVELLAWAKPLPRVREWSEIGAAAPISLHSLFFKGRVGGKKPCTYNEGWIIVSGHDGNQILSDPRREK